MITDKAMDEFEKQMEPTRNVLKDVLNERVRQLGKWCIQNHEQMIWMPILMEEVGEAAQVASEIYFQRKAGAKAEGVQGPLRDALREELIQVAAVAVSMIESLDRNGF